MIDHLTYDQKLLDHRWVAKRENILERDNHRCRACSSVEVLQVHHLAYILGADPWQVPDDFLITLCANCHRQEESFKREIKMYLRELSLKGFTHREVYEHLKFLESKQVSENQSI